MIYVIKTMDEYGEDKGIYSITTSITKMLSNIRKYMKKLKLDFGNGYNLKDFKADIPFGIEYTAITNLNKALECCNTKGTDGLEDYTLHIECWNNGDIDSSWL